jgi:hypothetical protein
MSKCLALIRALALLASPFLFAYLEAERLLGLPDAVYRWFDPWLPLVMILCSSVIALTLPWIIGLFGDDEEALL